MNLAAEIGEANVDAPEFFVRVYRVVRRIPAGRVSTYGDVAAAAGALGAARAVGTAMRECQDSVAVPCHRVVKADGTVGHYGSGSAGRALKVRLLAEEGVQVDPDTLRIRDFPRIRYTDF